MATAPPRRRRATSARTADQIKADLHQLFRERGKSLAWYHRVGRLLIDLKQALAEPEPGWFSALAEELDTSKENLTKIRRFAADFTAAEVQTLTNQGVQWGLVTAIQAVAAKQRLPLLREANDKQWGVEELKAVVKERFGIHHGGGRPLRKPKSARGGLCALQRQSERWLQFYTEVWNGGDDSVANALNSASKKKDRQAIAKLAPEIRQQLKRIEASCAAITKQLRQVERASSSP